MNALGRWGEDWALWKYVKAHRSNVIERNWRGEAGEIDLILSEGDEIVFAEVKTRSKKNPNPVGHVVVKKQQEHLQSAAREYYQNLPSLRPLPRFDLVIVQYDPELDSEPEILIFLNTMEPVNFR